VIKGNDQGTAVSPQDAFQANRLAKIAQAFSPVKRYNTPVL
jgi:hypothetical protein